MSELVRHSLQVERNSPLDETQRAVFDTINRQLPATYEQLSLPKDANERLREQFFASGRITNPDLSASHLNQDALSSQEADWLAFKDLLLDSDIAPGIKQVYRWAVNEAVANVRLAHYSALGDMPKFSAYNKFIYGRPNPEVFADTADWFRANAQLLADQENPQVAQAAREVLALVPDLGGIHEDLMPSGEVFGLIKDQHFKQGGYYALVLAGIELPPKTKVTNQTGDPALRRALVNIGSDYGLEDASGSTWSADHYREALLRPASYDLAYRRFLGLGIGHEMRHILERQNGLRQALGLFGLGLDRYEKGNEGRAVMGEQVVYDSFEQFAGLLRWQDILRRHFAISLAEGLSGEKMTFSQVFGVMNKIDRLWQRSKKPDDIPAADAAADKRTWDLMTRVMRGTDGLGGAYLKDISYLEGNISCWQTAAAEPQLIEAGDGGKFDITNPRHTAVAREFGVLQARPRAE